MNKTIFVISDLHLGGQPASQDKTSFQICSPANQRRLAEFVRWAAAQKTDQTDINLVLAGDIVDFLAEEPFQAFTSSDKDAERKLQQIIDHTSWKKDDGSLDGVWQALKDYVAAGGQLTLMLGNHDIELSLPSARRLLLKTLGAGRVEFIYDNEAFVDGKVIIEHGNRYDRWNAVNHDTLRQVRSALSRGEEPPQFPRIPGSELVIEVMNDLKKKYSFIDLLKPEMEAAIPFLVVLDPSAYKKIQNIYRVSLWNIIRRFDSDGTPKNRGLISAPATTSSDQKFLQEIRELTELPPPGQIGAIEHFKAFPDLWCAALAGKNEDKIKQIDKLYKALRRYVEIQQLNYNYTYESEDYLRAAKAMAKRGFEAIVFGHTHLAKRVNLAEINSESVYLNSGTWADLIFLPDSIIKGQEEQAKLDLEKLANDLIENTLNDWRKLVSTFVQIDLDKDKVISKEVRIFNSTEDMPLLSPIHKEN